MMVGREKGLTVTPPRTALGIVGRLRSGKRRKKNEEKREEKKREVRTRAQK